MDLSELMKRIGNAWTCDTRRYPHIPAEESPSRSGFERKHILLHMMQQVGHLAEIDEDLDHDPDHEDGGAKKLLRKEQIAKLLIDALKFAIVEGITPEELVGEIGNIIAPAPS